MLLAAAAVGFVALSGCSGSSTPTRPVAATPTSASPTATAADVAPSTAAGTVVAYYQRLGRHDAVGAAALLSPGLRAQMLAAGQEGEVANVKSLTNIREVKARTASFPPHVPVGYFDITQVFVTYDVVYVHPVAAQNGANSRFVYVARRGRGGPWQIVEIGTGP